MTCPLGQLCEGGGGGNHPNCHILAVSIIWGLFVHILAFCLLKIHNPTFIDLHPLNAIGLANCITNFDDS